MNLLENYIISRLENRKKEGLFRKLSTENNLVDFSSNDYLGFASSLAVQNNIEIPSIKITGSTGSRLITGNSDFTVELERFVANYHNAEACLIFNSGYDANLGFFSSVPQKGDTVIYDAFVHASIRDGIRLSNASNYSFRHNDPEDLIRKIKRAKGRIFVAVESVYSMDGDFAPLAEIAQICEQQSAALIVDEAHATGIFGNNGAGRVVELKLEEKIFARIHTFGKALGCHGAVVLGSESLRNYLINFSRPFIYTTALPLSTLINIKTAYLKLLASDKDILDLKKSISFFKSTVKVNQPYQLIESNSPIQCIIIPGIEQVKSFAEEVRKSGFDVRAILSPTVPAGKERVRICIHSFNNDIELKALINVISGLFKN